MCQSRSPRCLSKEMTERPLVGTGFSDPPASRAYLVKVCVTKLEITPNIPALLCMGSIENSTNPSHVPGGTERESGRGSEFVMSISLQILRQTSFEGVDSVIQI